MSDEEHLRKLERMLGTGDPAILVQYLVGLTRRGRTLEGALIFVAKRFARRAPRANPKPIRGGRLAPWSTHYVDRTIPQQFIGMPFLDLCVTVTVDETSDGGYEISLEKDELTGDGIVRVRRRL